MNKTVLLFLTVFVAVSIDASALGGVPISALLLEFETLRMQIEEAEVDQEVKDGTLELLSLAQSLALNPDHSTPIKLKQLDIVGCALGHFPFVGNSVRFATLNRISALLEEGSEAPDKPVQRDRPEVQPPAAACKVEILRLDTDSDVFEVAPPKMTLDGPYRNVFLSARASEPGTVNWFEIKWLTLLTEESYEIEERKLPLVVPLPEFGQKVRAAQNINGILEVVMTDMSASQLTGQGSVRAIESIIRAEFTSADGQRMCEDEITLTWHR